MKLPNVSIQIISFPPAISYTVNISSLMYTKQTVQLKKISLCLKKEKKRKESHGLVPNHMSLTTYSNDLKKEKRVQMMAKVLFCAVYFYKNPVCTPLSLSYMGDLHHSPWSQTHSPFNKNSSGTCKGAS